MSATSTAARGYILVRPNAALPSAIVDKAGAERMQRRFGGVIIPAKGLRCRVVNGMRVVSAVDLPEVKRRFEAVAL